MKIRFHTILFLLFVCVTISAAQRKWTLSTGKSFTAEAVGVKGSKICFQRKDGKTRYISIKKLSKKDIRYFYINVLSLPDYSKTRTWSLKKGSKKVKAKLFAVDNTKVYVKTSKGKKKAYKLSDLSSKDKKYIASTISDASADFGDTDEDAPPKKNNQQLAQQQEFDEEALKMQMEQFQQQGGDNGFQMGPRAATGLAALAGAGILISILMNAFLYSIFLWIAKMLTGCKTTFIALLVSSIIGSLVALIPVIGLFIPGIVQILVIMKISKTEFIDTLFMVVIANFLFVITSMVLLAKVMTSLGF